MLDYFDMCSKADKSQLNLLQRTKTVRKRTGKNQYAEKNVQLKSAESPKGGSESMVRAPADVCKSLVICTDDCQLTIDSLLVQDVSSLSLILLLHCCC